jgi:hypothetical protein
MAHVQIEQIVDHLSHEMRRALQDAIREALPNVRVDAHALFRSFSRAVGRKCNTWEQVPDQYVRD